MQRLELRGSKRPSLSFLLLACGLVSHLVPLVSAQELPPRAYAYLSYDAMQMTMHKLAADYPELVVLQSTTALYGLPKVGECGTKKEPCETLLLHITEHATVTPTRPQVYFSGEIHGDERVGPVATLEFARLLCEEFARNAWVRHLVRTRQVFITPMTNAVGFEQSKRNEINIDPNRDYPIDQLASADCMQAVTSRIVNELFRAHLFQLAVTFHGGMEAIAVEWGTTNRLKKELHPSPDDVAQLQIAGALSKYAGAFGSTPEYPIGRMNDIVYPVRGGMEDWAYAGSWDPMAKRTPCRPATHGGYAAERTTYGPQQLRAVNILVETSDEKAPSAATLGTTEGALDPHGKGGGHVARNVRLALALTDLVQPYVAWAGDGPPADAAEGDVVRLAWEVGGAFAVDATRLELVGADAVAMAARSADQRGTTRWATLTRLDRAREPFVAAFAACVRVPAWGQNVSATATVDAHWASASQARAASPANTAPQSHLVNARTNPQWKAAAGGAVVAANQWWSSSSLVLAARQRSDGRAPRVDAACAGVPVLDAASSSPPPVASSLSPSMATPAPVSFAPDMAASPVSVVRAVLIVVALVAGVAVCCWIARRRRMGRQFRALDKAAQDNFDDDLDDGAPLAAMDRHSFDVEDPPPALPQRRLPF